MLRGKIFAGLLMGLVGSSAHALGLFSPVMIRSQVDNGNLGFCSGVVISPTQVLTAAHCIEHNSLFEIFPDGDRGPALPVIGTSGRVHPRYNFGVSPYDFDIGIIEFSSNMILDQWSTAYGICYKDHIAEKIEQVSFGMRNGTHLRHIEWRPTFGLTPSRVTQLSLDGGSVLGDSGAPVFVLERSIPCLYAIHSTLVTDFETRPDGTQVPVKRTSFDPILKRLLKRGVNGNYDFIP